MFPTIKNRIATTVLSQLDVLVELTTLGEYGLDERGRPLSLEPQLAQPSVRRRGDCVDRLGSAREPARRRGADRPASS